jgi:cyclic pyranopterin phosphate synthase
MAAGERKPDRPDSFTHLDPEGRPRMVDVGDKPDTAREATAVGAIRMNESTLAAIKAQRIAKGDVLAVAQVAATMAAKRTADIIPLCHPLLLTAVVIHFAIDDVLSRIGVEATVRTTGKTGVEMEALTAVAAATLTIYDMCKAVDRGMVIEEIRLVQKSGGRSGLWRSEA